MSWCEPVTAAAAPLHRRRAEIEAAIVACGLAPRGLLAIGPDDGLPPLADGRVATALMPIGWLGRQGPAAFAASPEIGDGLADPLDRWSRRSIDDLADRFGALALYPFGGPPWWPFQRWGLRAEPLSPSPLGLLIHPQVGLWHGWRGALAFADDLGPIPPPPAVDPPCAACVGRPCLTTCPVDAFGAAGYDIDACLAHIHGPAGALCRTDGCRARDACPVGRGQRYGDGTIRFLMRAFRAAHPRSAEETR